MMKPVLGGIFAVLLLLASSHSFSATWWETGSYVGSTPINSVTAYCDASSSCLEVCRLISSTSTLYSYKTASYPGQCDTSNDSVTVFSALRSGSCPSTLSYEWPDATCHSEPPPNCDTSDPITFFWKFDINDSGITQVPLYHSDGNCLYYSTSNWADADDCGTWNLSGGGTASGCMITVEPTGQAGTSNDAAAANGNTSGTSEQLPTTTVTGQPQSDTTQSTQDSTVTHSEPSTAPDGTVTESQDTTTTTVSGQGTTVSDTPTTIVFTDSDGTTTVYSENKTTITHPDGTVTETINKDTATTSGAQDKTVIDKTSGQVTNITNNAGDTITYNQQTTNYYNSSGQKTGSNTTSSGDSNADADQGDENKEGNCGAPDQPPCDVKLKDTSSDYKQYSDSLNSEVANLAAQRQGLVDELGDTSNDYGASSIDNFNADYFISQYFQFPDVSCGNGIHTTIFGYSFDLDPCEKLEPLRDILAWVFFILTSFAMLNIMLGRRLF